MADCSGPPTVASTIFFCYLLHHYTQVDDKIWMLFSHCFRIILNLAMSFFALARWARKENAHKGFAIQYFIIKKVNCDASTPSSISIKLLLRGIPQFEFYINKEIKLSLFYFFGGKCET